MAGEFSYDAIRQIKPLAEKLTNTV
jgi:hypothetical protein